MSKKKSVNRHVYTLLTECSKIVNKDVRCMANLAGSKLYTSAKFNAKL